MSYPGPPGPGPQTPGAPYPGGHQPGGPYPGAPAPAPGAPGDLPPGAPTQWRPEMRAHPHPEPRSYPMMLRTWDYAWWKPVVGILLLVIGGMIIAPVLLLPVMAIAVALEGGAGPYLDRFVAALSLDDVTPASMLYLNLSLASLVLVSMGIMRFVHRLRPRWLSSVLPGMRWRFFFACFGLSVVALLASVGVSLLLPENPNDVTGEPNRLTGTLIATGIVILLTTPLQALGEEYAFRGYLMQAFGSLTRSRVAALLVTSGLFALAHGTQNFPLFFDRFAFGLMAGLTVILLGGLEAGIALHILNNLVAFGIAIFFGDLSGALQVTEVSWWQLPVTVAQNGVYLLLVLVVARRMGLRNRTTPPEQAAVPAG